MRRAAKVDRNHPEIVEAFRSFGYSVLDLSAVGKGCPDLLVAKGGENILIEIKDGEKSPSRRKLTKKQEELHESWRGRIEVVETVGDVRALDVYRWWNSGGTLD